MTSKQSAYFGEGRCSGHAQFNGGYCRDVAGPERWCIHCEGFMLQQQIAELAQTIATLTQERDEAVNAVGVSENQRLADALQEIVTLKEEIDILAPESPEHILTPEDEAIAMRVRQLMLDTVEKHGLATKLHRAEARLTRLTEGLRRLDVDAKAITAIAALLADPETP